MEINWFTVIAQIVNFLILVWLLKRFLYKPVLKAIDERQKKITAQLEDAALSKAEAVKNKEIFRQKNETFDKERLVEMNKAHEEVNSKKERLFDKVRQESTALRLKLEDSLKQRELAMMGEIKQKTKDAVFDIVDKTLSDLANATLEDQVIRVFIKKLDDLNEVNRSKFITALNNRNGPVTIKSAFEFPKSSKQELEKMIEDIVENQIQFNYELKPNLLSGIEIETENYQFSWNIESYLNSLNKDNGTMEKANGIN